MRKLTKKSRWMLYLSIFISSLVVLSALLYFQAAKEKSDYISKAILIIIIIIAVLAVISMIISRLRIRKNTSNLTPAFFETYEQISDKLQGVAMSNLEKKETLSDILDLFLLASKDKRKVADVVGNDIDDFVYQIQQSFGYRSKLVFNILTGIQYSILYLFMMQGVEYLKSNENSFYNVGISISMALYLIPLAFIGIPLITNFIRKNKLGLVIVVPLCILVMFIVFMETMHKYFIDIPWVYTLVEGDFSCIPSLGMLILWLVLLAIASLLKWVQRKVSISKL